MDSMHVAAYSNGTHHPTSTIVLDSPCDKHQRPASCRDPPYLASAAEVMAQHRGDSCMDKLSDAPGKQTDFGNILSSDRRDEPRKVSRVERQKEVLQEEPRASELELSGGSSDHGGHLVVGCQWKDQGCSWEGTLEEREAHLDAKVGNCGFVEVECEFGSAGCPARVMRKYLPTHYRDAVHDHLALFSKVSLGKWAEIQNKVDETFSHLQVQIQDKQVEVLTTSKVLQEWREELKDAVRRKDDQIEELKKQLADSRREIGCIREELQSKSEHMATLQSQLDIQDRQLLSIGVALVDKDRQIERFTQTIEGLTAAIKGNGDSYNRLQSRGSDTLDSESNCIPFTFVLPDFTVHQRNATLWESPPFYSHPRGYKLCARVYANHKLLGEGTHVSLFLYVLPGEHDDALTWPRKLIVCAEILNQATGAWEKKKTHSNTWQNPHFYHQGGSGWPKFIAYSELNSITGVEYLRDDCICFRIPSIRMQ